MNNKYIRILIISLLAIVAGNSCKDELPGNVVPADDFYQNRSDADNAVIGLYAQFAGLAAQVVVLNELRADLMDVTLNASTELEKLNMGIADKNNQWTKPTQFFAVIQTCNDILENFDRMKAENKLTENEYGERYSDVAAIRCWVYLQMCNIYGNVPYITSHIENIEDVKTLEKQIITPDELIAQLISCMESLPVLENYQFADFIVNVPNGYAMQPLFINKKCLLGDLYLNAGQYDKAAQIYRQVMATNENSSNVNDQLRTYRIMAFPFTAASGVPDWYQICFRDGRTEDFSQLINTWSTIFAATPGERQAAWEHIWYIPFDNKLSPQNPFHSLFVTQYQLKPSDYSIDSLWKKPMKNQYPADVRGIGGGTVQQDNSYVIAKYSYIGNISGQASQMGSWFLYRAAMLNLRYAEAANRAGYTKLAWALVNSGLAGGTFNFKHADGSDYTADSVNMTGWSPTRHYPEPYYFDARTSRAPRPNITGSWANNGGIRGRANMPNIDIPAYITTTRDSMLFVEDMIIDEAGLELAWEGHRWADLVRVARRLNREQSGAGDAFLWNRHIKKKYDRSGSAAPDMSTETKWYLPLF